MATSVDVAIAGTTGAQPPEPGRQPGVNLVGFLEGELGLGEVARKLGRGLERAGIPFSAISYRRAPSRQPHPVEIPISDEAPFDINVICLNADYLHTFLADAGADFFAGRYTIGVWFWESSIFRPENLEGLRFVDEVWVASEYVRRAIAAQADVPVHVVPLPIEAPTTPPRSPAEQDLPGRFTFLFVFDFVSAQRKNPTAVVEAFKQAFEPGEGPVLVMKSINGKERKPQWLDDLVSATEGRPDIRVIDAYVAADQRDALLAACDCYVSLHRSEGFGLTVAEAMAHGKPVIATGYSGNLEFMNESNGYLVPYLLTQIPEDWWAYSPGADWAEPDVGAAAMLMRAVYDDQEEARSRGARAREDVLNAFSLDRTAEFITDRLRDVRGRGGRTQVASSAQDPRISILGASQELGRGIGASLTVGAGRRPRLVRRLLVRALWPYLADQHRLNSLTLDAMIELQRSVDDLSRRLEGLDTRSAAREPVEEHSASDLGRGLS
jgi:glycosyltransferase involved in cell wall biosynthesis